MSRERTPAGNILALSRSREERARDVEDAATSYMPTDIDLDTLMPDRAPHGQAEPAPTDARRPDDGVPGKRQQQEAHAPRKGRAAAAGADPKRKRISLYLDDDVLAKIFRVSLERHEQLSSATQRLILEALKARGL